VRRRVHPCVWAFAYSPGKGERNCGIGRTLYSCLFRASLHPRAVFRPAKAVLSVLHSQQVISMFSYSLCIIVWCEFLLVNATRSLRAIPFPASLLLCKCVFAQ